MTATKHTGWVYGYDATLGRWYLESTVTGVQTYLYPHLGEYDAQRLCVRWNQGYGVKTRRIGNDSEGEPIRVDK